MPKVRKFTISIGLMIGWFSILLGAGPIEAQVETVNKRVQLTVPLFINGVFQIELRSLAPRFNETFQFDGVAFLDSAERGLREDIHTALYQRLDPNWFLTIEDLREFGLKADFNLDSLEFRVVVPPEMLLPQLIKLQGGPPAAGAATKPATFSSFINARSFVENIHSTEISSAQTGRQPLEVNFDGAFNVHGTALEWAGTFREDRERPWQRSDVRIIHDLPDQRWRTSLGDLSYPTVGFQGFVASGGLTFAKNFNLQPYRVTQPTVRGSFILQRESKVEIIVNDRVVRTLRLAPGPYDVSDFPFTSGINNAKLRITDPAGQVQVLEYPFVLDSNLLKPGEDEFSYSLGFPSSTRDGLRKYDTSLPGFSLFHRYGLTNSLTIGANFQANHLQKMAGVEAVWATREGVLGLDLGWGQVYNYRDAVAARLEFSRDDQTAPKDLSRIWNFSAEFKGQDFAPLGTTSPLNTVKYDFSARVSQQLPWDINVGLGGSYRVGRSEQADSDSQNLVISKRLNQSVSTSLQFERQTSSSGGVSQSAYVSLDISMPANGQRLSVSRDTGTRSTRFDWTRNSPDPVGGLDAKLTLERTPESHDLSGEAVFTGTRGRASLTHDIIQTRKGRAVSTDRDRRSTLRLESALVFADGEFGIGRPVSNSFALLTRHPSLADHPLGVNPVGDTHIASIDQLGPAVLPELSPYRISHIQLDAPEVPQGIEIGNQRFTVQPTYKSGTLIQVGTGATVFLLGRIHDQAGNPIGLTAGEIFPKDQSSALPISTFTNRTGRFAAEGLIPGHYRLSLFTVPERSVSFEIPKETIGRYDVGILMLPEREKKP